MDEKDNNHEDPTIQIDLIVQGLRDLHHKFAVSREVLESQVNEDKVQEEGRTAQGGDKNDGILADPFKDPFLLQSQMNMAGHSDPKQQLKQYEFTSEKDQCLQALKELFLYRIKENKERKMRLNEKNVKAIRDVPRILWITQIMSFMQVDECLKLGRVSMYFNQITRSPIFVKHYVQFTQQTKVDVSANYFDLDKAANQHIKRQKAREDKEAQIELLQNMKIFLTEKIVQSEQRQQTNLKDLQILKDMHTMEKNMNTKKDQIIKDKDQQLKQVRDESLEQQQENLIKINELNLKIEDLQKTTVKQQDDLKKFKMHKKLLKDEVVSQRQKITELEGKLGLKSQALKNLGDFFKKQTAGMDLVMDEKGKGDKSSKASAFRNAAAEDPNHLQLKFGSKPNEDMKNPFLPNSGSNFGN